MTDEIKINIIADTTGKIYKVNCEPEMSEEEKELCKIFCQCGKCRLFGMCPNFGWKYNKETLKKMLEWEAP